MKARTKKIRMPVLAEESENAATRTPIRVRAVVTPGARREEFEYIGEHSFSVRVREEAERNEANDRVRQLIAEHYTVPLTAVRLLTGHRGKKKSFSVVL